MNLTSEAIFKVLTRGNLNPILQENTGQVYFEAVIQGKQVPTFFGILGEGYLLQIISYLPFELKEERFGDIARLLHRLNKELDLPGYGMDEEHKLLFYRTVFYCDQKELNEKLLDIYLKSSQLASAALIDSMTKLLAKRGV